MSFHDEVMKNLHNAPNIALQEQNVKFQAMVQKLCEYVKDGILYAAKNHTQSGYPFCVETHVVAHSQFAFKCISETERKPGLFDTTRYIREFLISDELVAFRNAVKNQLEQDGIRVGEWKVTSHYFSSDSSDFGFSIENYDIFNNRYFKKPEILNINPYAICTVRGYQTIGAMSPHNRYELSQGNTRYTDKDLSCGYRLFYTISYPG